jgi:hypothetical protein
MKKIIKKQIKIVLFSCFASLFASSAFAVENHHVREYTTKRGTYITPHRQTNPNRTQRDNWSTRGNTNPYTGKVGTIIPKR